ncbi:MAG: hypothetical protein J0M07_30105 [Anaerolineae bacterium]|jgi:uncharacterized protein YbaR (Trm112 family)|nr:hypothetical protein [Chloroflexota bacterium]MBN8639609.1 hypothetical protein [Anaerolineae bacterium]
MAQTFDPKMLDLLRCPAAVKLNKQPGDDFGKLELYKDSWLISKDSGNKYPIKNGIPIMLIEEGEKYKNTPVEQLPVP